MSEIELLPCPFCGGRPEVIEFTKDDGFENRGGSAIECQRCLASSRVEFGRKENLVSSWNRRAALSSTVLEEQLAEALKALTNLVQEIDDLVSESEGVAGLHLNGDVAEWCDLLPGGRYERLTSLDDARRARNITIEMIKLALASDWRASFVKIEG